MAKTKAKTEANKVKRRKVDFGSGARSGESPPQIDAQAMMEYWQEESKELLDTTFPNETVAVSALIGRVVMRLKTPSELVTSTTKFLETIIMSDPALMKELRAMFKLKS